MKRSCYLVLLLLASQASGPRAQNITRSYPFTMPDRDTGLSAFLPQRPIEQAGVHGTLSITPDGHIGGADGSRIKFFGTALWGNAQFLPSADARLLAGRLRKLGFNAVHFANNDLTGIDDPSFFASRDSAGKTNKSSYIVNPAQLAKFDTLFADLKRNGIYTVFSLMTNHRYLSGDGLMYFDSTYGSGILSPLIDPAAAMHEREWARTLLSHRNLITGLRYADDPAFAIVEYNYENSLFYYWNSLDRLVYIDQNNYGKGKNTISWHYSRRLDTLFNDFLTKKYGSEQNLKSAWGGTILATNKNYLDDGSFEDAFSTAWSFNVRNGATAVVNTGDGGIDSQVYVKIRINALASAPNAGDITYSNISPRLGKDTLYAISFWAKMNFDAVKLLGKTGRSIVLSLAGVGTGAGRGFSQTVAIDTSWKQYTLVFRSAAAGLQQLSIQCGRELGDVWLDACSVKMQSEASLTTAEHLATSTVLRQRNDGTLRLQPLQRLRDQIAYYDSLEKSFFRSMDGLIKDTLGFHGLVNHRQNNFWQLLPDVYAASDGDITAVDYSNDFANGRSGQTFADSTWMIRNTAMVKSKSASAVGFVSAGAVKGKGFILGDFQIPWPNAYNSEQMMLLPAWGDYQDWDGIFFSPYAVSRSELFADSLVNPFRSGGGFTSISNNPATLALAPVASRLFLGSLVQKAGYFDSLIHDPDDVWLTSGFAISHGTFGVEGPLESNIVTKLGIRQSFNSSKHKIAAEYPYLADTAVKLSDTQELRWDETNGLFTITSPEVSGASGLFGNTPTMFPSWSFSRTDAAASKEQIAIYLLSLDQLPLDSSKQMLLTVTTRAQNTGISWLDSNGFGKNFGTAPTVLSAATLSLNFLTTSDTLILTPLDGTVSPLTSETITAARLPGAPNIPVTIDQQQTRTPWYLLSFKEGGSQSSVSQASGSGSGSFAIFPNPAQRAATLRVQLERPEFVRVRVVDMLGRTVASPFEGAVDPNSPNVRLDLRGIPPGVCQVIVTTAEESVSMKLTILQ